MDSSTKRLLLATAISMVIMVGWLRVMSTYYPPPKPPAVASRPTAETGEPFATSGGASQPALSAGPEEEAAGSRPAASQGPATRPAGYAGVGAGRREEFEIGALPASAASQPTIASADGYWLDLRLTSHGAAIDSAKLTPKEYRFTVARTKNSEPDPYPLMEPWQSPVDGRKWRPFETPRLTIEGREVDLSGLEWSGRKEIVRDEGGRERTRVIFEAEVQNDARPCLRLRKTYALSRGSFDMSVRIEAENLSDRPLPFALYQDGPLGICRDAPLGGDSAGRIEDRYFVVGIAKEEKGTRAVAHQRASFVKAEGQILDLVAGERLNWVAHTNKWFICIIYPMPAAAGPEPGAAAMTLQAARAFTRTADENLADDMQIALRFGTPTPLSPAQSAAIDLDVYMGPRSHERFTQAATTGPLGHPDYAARGYDSVLNATGGSCAWLTFQPLLDAMRWLLANIHRPLSYLGIRGSYGWSIIVLVLIVRTLLHGVTKRGQIGMMRMQKQTAALAPKVEALKARYADDTTTLNKETMRLYREAGINPVSQMSGCLLGFIQMPIWIALWTTLNTSIELRHAPFLSWMRDLSGPDALIPFAQSYTIPILGFMTGPIHSFNLLPLIMGLTMYLQQKLTAKLTAAKAPPPSTASADGKPSPSDQMKQQQMMMTIMSPMFALMLYNSPCGLNLYIFTSNLFGMLEQWRIRKHISAIDIDGAAAAAGPDQPGGGNGGVPPKGGPKRGPGLWGRLQKKAEDLQKRADQGRLASDPENDARRARRQQARKH